MSNFERLYGAPLPPGRYEVSREDMQRIQSGGPLTFTDEEIATAKRGAMSIAESRARMPS